MNKKGHMPIVNSKGKVVFVDMNPLILWTFPVMIMTIVELIITFAFRKFIFLVYIIPINLFLMCLAIYFSDRCMKQDAEDEIGIQKMEMKKHGR